MPKVFDYCPADKFEGDDGCAGCHALPGTEHCEAVFRDSTTGCFHCDMGFPMSESGKEHFWCDQTGTRDFSAPCTNSTPT